MNAAENRAYYVANRQRILDRKAGQRRAAGVPVRRAIPVAERFWDKVEKSPGCWTWLSARDRHGYGRIGLTNGRAVLAHRVAYELVIGPIPSGMVLDHLCRNPPCVNPAHLEVVTQAENMRRAAAAITHCPRGHAYDEANTYRNPSGDRICRTCTRQRHQGSSTSVALQSQ